MFNSIDKMIFCAGGGIGHFAALKQNYLEENHILGTWPNFGFERVKKRFNLLDCLLILNVYKQKFFIVLPGPNTLAYFAAMSVTRIKINSTDKKLFCSEGLLAVALVTLQP
jgi:hypothetical protein